MRWIELGKFSHQNSFPIINAWLTLCVVTIECLASWILSFKNVLLLMAVTYLFKRGNMLLYCGDPLCDIYYWDNQCAHFQLWLNYQNITLLSLLCQGA